MDIWAFFETPNSRKRRCYISGRLANKTSLNDVFWKGQNYCQNFEKQYSSKTWYLIPTEIVLHRTNGSRVLIKYLSMDPRKRIGNFQKVKTTFMKEVKQAVTTLLAFICSKVSEFIFPKQYHELTCMEPLECFRLWCNVLDMLFIVYTKLQEICQVPK